MRRSKHNLSHYKLFSGDMGELIPIGLTEVLPGDSFQHNTTALVRLSPLLAPLMHRVDVTIHHWYVPMRLIWDDWEDFITGGPDNDDASVLPTIDSGAGFAVGSLADYLGVPPSVANLDVSALPFRAYALIWNEWYRDQDLQIELTIDTGSGPDSTTNTNIVNRAWEKDYFTTARPWPQKGPEITLPLGDRADIHSQTYNNENASGVKVPGGGPNTYTPAGSGGDYAWTNQGAGTAGIWADLSTATAASINDLREAFALQSMAEARALFGSRYTEYLRYLGVTSSDARLQRPEYLGGGRQTLQISEVLQTGVTTGGSTEGVGNLKGHGIGAMRSNRYRRFFEEHGYVLTLFSVKPKTMYVQGLPKTWSRAIKEDFWQKELEKIGQAQILNKELYAAHSSPDGVFGWQDRYDEYRRTESTVAGDMRTTLNFWHMARTFGTEPTLNADFVQAVPTKRVFQVQNADVMWVMAHHTLVARRLVSANGVPRRLF